MLASSDCYTSQKARKGRETFFSSPDGVIFFHLPPKIERVDKRNHIVDKAAWLTPFENNPRNFEV